MSGFLRDLLCLQNLQRTARNVQSEPDTKESFLGLFLIQFYLSSALNMPAKDTQTLNSEELSVGVMWCYIERLLLWCVFFLWGEIDLKFDSNNVKLAFLILHLFQSILMKHSTDQVN